ITLLPGAGEGRLHGAEGADIPTIVHLQVDAGDHRAGDVLVGRDDIPAPVDGRTEERASRRAHYTTAVGRVAIQTLIQGDVLRNHTDLLGHLYPVVVDGRREVFQERWSEGKPERQRVGS